jgi:hypothetical protein
VALQGHLLYCRRIWFDLFVDAVFVSTFYSLRSVRSFQVMSLHESHVSLSGEHFLFNLLFVYTVYSWIQLGVLTVSFRNFAFEEQNNAGNVTRFGGQSNSILHGWSNDTLNSLFFPYFAPRDSSHGCFLCDYHMNNPPFLQENNAIDHGFCILNLRNVSCTRESA